MELVASDKIRNEPLILFFFLFVIFKAPGHVKRIQCDRRFFFSLCIYYNFTSIVRQCVVVTECVVYEDPSLPPDVH